MKETLDMVVQGGALGLLALLLAGAIYLAAGVLPSIRAFFDALTTKLQTLETRAAVLEAKVDANTAAIKVAGEVVAAMLGRVGDAVASEAFEVRQEVAAAERRITAAVRREQASDPPPRSSSALARRASVG